MIGALSSIEDKFGFLWGSGQEEPLTDEQEIMKDLYNAERQAQAAKMDWHLRKLTEAREAGNQFNVDWHDAEIAGCELRLHQLKKFV